MLVNITLKGGSTPTWQNAKWWQDANRRAAIFSRFWSCVKRGTADECWEWTGFVESTGYGTFSVDKLRYRAHRFSWLFSRGEIPSGLQVCHRCDNPRCVNPSHLFTGTQRDNHLDAVRKGRKRAWGLQKLNAAQVHEIRALVASGWTQKAAGQRFGVARNTVSQIINGKTWGHLERAS